MDGHVYAIPYAQYVQALYYRKDLFRASGLDPDRAPTNWNEFYHCAQAMTDQPKGQWGFEFEKGEASYYWINFLWQAGGDVTAPNRNGVNEAAFDSPAGVTALEFYRKLIAAPWTDKEGKTWSGVATNSSTRAQDIQMGKVGMWFAYQSDDVSNMNQFDINPSLIGIAAMPRGPTGITANEINAGMWGINASVRDPKKLQACWDFIRFMASEEAARIRCAAYVENGLGMLVNPVELKKYGYTEYLSPAQEPWARANRELFAHGKPEPSGPAMQFIYALMEEPLDRAILYPDRPAQQILHETVYKINTKLLGYTPPAEMRRKRVIAWTIFALLMSLGGAFAARALLLTFRLRTRRTALEPRLPLRIHLSAWTFMAPAVASVAVWAYLPLARGMIMAFQDYRILGGTHWIGMDNFIEAVGQQTFWIGITNAFKFTAWQLGLGFCLPVVLALLLNEIPRGKVLFRVLYYLPAVTTSVVVIMLWKWFWDPTPHGLANTLIAFVGIGTHKWLDDPAQAMFALTVPLVWAAAGPGSIIYLAALQGIPDEMYEAADLDGAGSLTKVWRVTLPALMPLIIINLVGATIAAFKIMEPVMVATGGGPDYATHTIGLEIWQNAFMYLKFGYATAAAWLMGSILIILTIYQLRILQNVRFSAGGR